MTLEYSDGALVAAGCVGAITAGLHGVIMQRRMIAPLNDAVRTAGQISTVTRHLMPALLQVSTVAWLLTGLLLIWAGIRAAGEPRTIAAAFGLAVYGHAALANVLAVRGFHPGWLLMAVSVALILVGVL